MNLTRLVPHPSSADWQSAVSRIGNPLRVRESDALPTASRRIQQVTNLRYSKTFRKRVPVSGFRQAAPPQK
jgi:hypothetical protein